MCKLVDQTEQVLKPVYSSDNFEQVQTCNSNLEDTNMWISESVYASSQYYALQELEERYYLAQDKTFQTLLTSQFTCLSQEQVLALRTEEESTSSHLIPVVPENEAYKAKVILDHGDSTFSVVEPYFEVDNERYTLKLNVADADLCSYYGFSKKVHNHSTVQNNNTRGRLYNRGPSFIGINHDYDYVVFELRCKN